MEFSIAFQLNWFHSFEGNRKPQLSDIFAIQHGINEARRDIRLFSSTEHKLDCESW